MEELKNIRNFQEFKDSVNEELLWGAIKNLFAKLFSKMDKKLADSVNAFTQKIDKAKTYQESVTLFEQTLNERTTKLPDLYNSITGPLGARKLLADWNEALFVTCQIMANKYQNPALAAKNIFKGTQDEKLFQFDSSEEFVKNITDAMNLKLEELNGKTNPPAYNPEQLKAYLSKNKNIDTIEKPQQQQNTDQQQQQNTDQQQQNTDQQQQQQQQQQSAKNTEIRGNSTESFIYNEYKDKLNEEDNPLSSYGNTQQHNAQEQKKQQNQQQQNQQQQNQNDQNAVPAGNIKTILDGPALEWAKTLHGEAIKKVKEIKPPAAGSGGKDPYDAIAANSKATGNTQNLAKLLRNIVNIPETKTLANVRNAIAQAQGKDKEQFKKEIGEF